MILSQYVCRTRCCMILYYLIEAHWHKYFSGERRSPFLNEISQQIHAATRKGLLSTTHLVPECFFRFITRLLETCRALFCANKCSFEVQHTDGREVTENKLQCKCSIDVFLYHFIDCPWLDLIGKIHSTWSVALPDVTIWWGHESL